MAQSLYVFGAQLTKFGVPSLNRGLGDVVLSRNVVDRRPSRLAQDLDDLALRKFHSLHRYRKDGSWAEELENGRAILPGAAL